MFSHSKKSSTDFQIVMLQWLCSRMSCQCQWRQTAPWKRRKNRRGLMKMAMRAPLPLLGVRMLCRGGLVLPPPTLPPAPPAALALATALCLTAPLPARPVRGPALCHPLVPWPSGRMTVCVTLPSALLTMDPQGCRETQELVSMLC